MSADSIRVAVVTAIVVAWRLAALSWPNPSVEIADDLRLPLTLLGFLCLTCGLVTWVARPGRWARLVFVVGAAGGVHWGGAIGFELPELDLGLLLVYLGASAAGQAALLHLAIVYPIGGRPTAPLLVALYAPAVAVAAAAPFVTVLPRSVLAMLPGLLMQLSTAFAVVAALIFVVNLVRLHGEMRRAARLAAIVVAIVVGGGVPLAATAGLLPGSADAWNLSAVAIPFALAYALITTPLDAPG